MPCRLSLSAAMVSVGVALWTSPAAGQLVQIGPGYVKAPFVRVYTGPDGSTHVRAPFVSIYSPSRGYIVSPPPIAAYAQPVYGRPTPFARLPGQPGDRLLAELAQLDRDSLVEHINDHAGRLSQWLAGVSGAKGWRNYLHTETMSKLLSSSDLDSETSRIQLEKIVSTYSATRNTPRFRHIAESESFQHVQGGLFVLLNPPDVGPASQLANIAQVLHRDLSELEDADSWRRYLHIPADILADRDTAKSVTTSAPSSRDAVLQETLARFDAVANQPIHRDVAQLPSFHAAHERLRAEVKAAREKPTPATPVRLELEELPPPLPR